MRLTFALLLTALGVLMADPPVPEQQQPFMVRHTNLVTNVTVSVTTTISEVQGFKVDSQFFPLRTNLMFKTVTNIWSSP